MKAKAYRKRKRAKTVKGNSTPRNKSLVQRMKPLQDGILPCIEFDMGQREYAGIGYAVAHWAFLEWAILFRTKQFARRAKVRLPKEAHDNSFARRIRLLRSLVMVVLKDSKRRKWWQDILSKIGNENGTRQKIVHGIWSYDARRPERLFSSSRFSKNARLTPFTPEKLFEFGHRVGELSCALLDPAPGVGRPPKLPNGFFAYASRSFLLTLAGKAEALGFSRSIPARSEPPESSFLAKFLQDQNTKDHSRS